MAVAGTEYTVFGFDSRLDWRPTVFVDRFPPTKVCSACGVIPSTLALLPCRHVLCRRCYAPSRDEERSHCPLDKDVHELDDVTWSTTTKDNVLKRKIRCWNSSNGCDVLGAVPEIMDHFEDCQYHVVNCFRCNQTIGFKELAGHLETNCSGHENSTGNSSRGIRDASVALFAQGIGELREKLSSLQTCFQETKEVFASQMQVFRERAAADMLVAESVQTLDNTLKESRGQSQVASGRVADELSLMRGSISAITNTLSEVVIFVKETQTSLDISCAQNISELSSVHRSLQQKLNDLSVTSGEESRRIEQRLDSLERTANVRVNEVNIEESLKLLNERLHSAVCEKLSVLSNGVKAILQNTFNISEPLIWTVEKWSELKKEAASQGNVDALATEPKCFFGYSVLPGIRIQKNDEGQTLYLRYNICQGSYDSLLTWPFQNKLYLHVLDAEEKEIPSYIIINSSHGAFPATEMPSKARNNMLLSLGSIKVTDIERNRCVVDDKVSFKFKVLRL